MVGNSQKIDYLRVFTAFSGYDSQCLALDLIREASFTMQKKDGKLYGGCQFDYDLVGWSEIDKYAIQAHNALFPQWSDRNYGDISKIDWSQVPDFDLFTYSSPCQDFSQAGLQKGAAKGSGTRSSLLWECERAIKAKKPKYLIFENVPAVISKKFIELFNQWQLALSRMGYTNFVSKLNAKTHGFPAPVPQNRERVFMVSILNCDRCFYFPEETPLNTCIADILEKDVDEKYYISADRIYGMQISTAKQNSKGNKFAFKPKEASDTANSITTKGCSRKTDNYIKVVADLQPDNKRPHSNNMRQQNAVISADGISAAITSMHANHAFKILEPQVLWWSRDKNGDIINRHPVDVANTITVARRDNTQNYVVIPTNTSSGYQQMEVGGVCDLSYPNSKTRRGRIQDGGKVSPTLTCNTENCLRRIEAQDRIRKFTPRECFRLMGVADIDIDKIQNAGISNSRQYMLAGNSIVVNCFAAILRQLIFGNCNKAQQSEVF